jgi:transposase-like protein
MTARFGARKTFDWVAMQAYIHEGNGFIRCRARFGIAHATWMKAIRCGDLTVNTTGKPYADSRKRYDWAEIQRFYDEGHSIRECQRQFGFSNASWAKARRRREVVARAQRWTIDELLVLASSRFTVKRRLLADGIIHNKCDWCGLSEWRGRALSIQLDHVNGVYDDHRLENLRMLCPNCHSQTETFGAKGRRRYKQSRFV